MSSIDDHDGPESDAASDGPESDGSESDGSDPAPRASILHIEAATGKVEIRVDVDPRHWRERLRIIHRLPCSPPDWYESDHDLDDSDDSDAESDDDDDGWFMETVLRPQQGVCPQDPECTHGLSEQRNYPGIWGDVDIGRWIVRGRRRWIVDEAVAGTDKTTEKTLARMRQHWLLRCAPYAKRYEAAKDGYDLPPETLVMGIRQTEREMVAAGHLVDVRSWSDSLPVLTPPTAKDAKAAARAMVLRLNDLETQAAAERMATAERELLAMCERDDRPSKAQRKKARQARAKAARAPPPLTMPALQHDPPPTIRAPAKSMAKDNVDDDAHDRDERPRSRACVVCDDLVAAVALVPCGHLCMCLTCAELVDECPLCRLPIDQRLRVFIA